MADTTTSPFGFTKPEIGASEDTWGTKLNANWEAVDNCLDGTTAIKPNLTEGQWKVGGVAVTSSAAELNKLDGAALDLAAVTASAAEVNVLDGVTATTAEINYLDGVTSNIQTQLNNILSDAYPVGSIYINASVSTNPATLLGFGTWTSFGAGRVLVGVDAGDASFDTLGETGGSKDAIVVSHTHTATSTVTDPGHTHNISIGGQESQVGRVGQGGTSEPATYSTLSATTGISVATSVASTGSSGTNANLQPYITVYMWKRTA